MDFIPHEILHKAWMSFREEVLTAFYAGIEEGYRRTEADLDKLKRDLEDARKDLIILKESFEPISEFAKSFFFFENSDEDWDIARLAFEIKKMAENE